ncbi:MAG: hypothetical protein K2G76_01565, partial [Prevotella sp.]|nr:hypothetical protein [Prevotella sp.]
MKKPDIKFSNIKAPTKRQFALWFFGIVVVLAAAKRLTTTPSTAELVATEVTTLRTDAPHRILSVPNYNAAFPDNQNVQIVAAEQWGVRPVQNREDAEARKKELVYVAASPYYHVDKLSNSIPYLVPRASVLLQDIGQAFYDSLYVKGVPLNQLIVTSVLRTVDDVA